MGLLAEGDQVTLFVRVEAIPVCHKSEELFGGGSMSSYPEKGFVRLG